MHFSNDTNIHLQTEYTGHKQTRCFLPYNHPDFDYCEIKISFFSLAFKKTISLKVRFANVLELLTISHRLHQHVVVKEACFAKFCISGRLVLGDNHCSRQANMRSKANMLTADLINPVNEEKESI